jgi:Zn ribbon nucleic-acid-binding protein
MSTYIFELRCPRCDASEQLICTGKDQEVPHVNCGNCLWSNVEIVELKIISVEVSNGQEA